MHYSPHGRAGRGLRTAAVSALCVLFCLAAAPSRGDSEALAFAGTPRPALLDKISQLERTLAVSLDAAGLRAAAAISIDEKESEIRLFGEGAPEVVNELRGTVRDLLLTPDGGTVLGIGHRTPKRGSSESFLFQIDFSSGKMRRVMRLRKLDGGIDEHAPVIFWLLQDIPHNVEHCQNLTAWIGTGRALNAVAQFAEPPAIMLVDHCDD